MKIVLDTNVLISGLLCPYGPPGEIVRRVSSGILSCCHDSRILSEYREVMLRPKFGFRDRDVDDLMEQIQHHGFSVSGASSYVRLPDKDDEVFLEIALAGRASYLVTGNLKHFSTYKGKAVKIIQPTEFLKHFNS